MLNSDLAGKRVLVTGAAGCIGAWVVHELLGIGSEPIVYDITENRFRLSLISANAEVVRWIKGDITDFDQLCSVVSGEEIFAIIHLAALQVPFAKADPVLGTRVNVLGTTHIFEAARRFGIRRITYASSIAAPAMGDNDYLETLYGAHKVCNEQMAAVYWQDWKVPSVCIRPAVIYGPGRDQGMSAAPTLAMLAAFGGHNYDIPFTGPVSYVHAQDAAQRFIGAIGRETEGSPVFDMNGAAVDMGNVLQAIGSQVDENGVSASGPALPFPALPDDGKLDEYVHAKPHRSFSDGVADTIEIFAHARSRGILSDEVVASLLGHKS